MDDFVLSAFSGYRGEYCFDWENVRFTLHLDSGLFQSENGAQYTNLQLHSHPHYEWFFVTGGSLRVTAEGRDYPLQKHDFAIIRPQQPHCVHAGPGNLTRYNFGFTFTGNGLAGGYDLLSELQAMLGDAPVVCGAGTPEMAEANRTLTQLCGTVRSRMLCATFAQLLAAVQEALGVAPSTASLEPLLRDVSIPRNERLQRVLEGYYMYDLSLERVAGGLGISTRQLNRITMRLYGTTFHDRLTYMRICSARQMLLRTDYRVGEIARWVGYPSLSAFYTAFKRQYGCLPTEFRRRERDG